MIKGLILASPSFAFNVDAEQSSDIAACRHLESNFDETRILLIFDIIMRQTEFTAQEWHQFTHPSYTSTDGPNINHYRS